MAQRVRVLNLAEPSPVSSKGRDRRLPSTPDESSTDDVALPVAVTPRRLWASAHRHHFEQSVVAPALVPLIQASLEEVQACLVGPSGLILVESAHDNGAPQVVATAVTRVSKPTDLVVPYNAALFPFSADTTAMLTTLSMMLDSGMDALHATPSRTDSAPASEDASHARSEAHLDAMNLATAVSAFRTALDAAALKHSNVTVVVSYADALAVIESAAGHFQWLPTIFSPNVHIVLTVDTASKPLVKLLKKLPVCSRVKVDAIPFQSVVSTATQLINAPFDQPQPSVAAAQGSASTHALGSSTPRVSAQEIQESLATVKVKFFGGLLSRLTYPASHVDFIQLWVAAHRFMWQQDHTMGSLFVDFSKSKTLMQLGTSIISATKESLESSPNVAQARLSEDILHMVALCQTGISAPELGLVLGVSPDDIAHRVTTHFPHLLHCTSDTQLIFFRHWMLRLCTLVSLDTMSNVASETSSISSTSVTDLRILGSHKTKPVAAHARISSLVSPLIQQFVVLADASRSPSEGDVLGPVNQLPYAQYKRSVWRLFLRLQEAPEYMWRCQVELNDMPQVLKQPPSAQSREISKQDQLIAVASAAWNITSLDVSSTSVDVRELCEVIRLAPSLQTLDVSYTRLSESTMMMLSSALATSASMNYIIVNGNSLTDEESIRIALALPSHIKSATGLAGWDVARVIRQLGNGALELTLTQKESLSPSSLEQVIQVIRKAHALQRLTITHHNMEDEIGIKLIRALATCQNLHTINLSHNLLTNETVFELARSFKNHGHLRTLILAHNKLRDDTGVALGKLIHGRPPLRKIDLTHNLLQDKGSRGLAEAFKTDKHLQELSLAQNKYITYMGIRFLCEGLRSTPSLQIFSFKDNIGTGDQGASMFAEALRYNKSLEEFDMRNTNIGSTGRAALQDAASHHPSCTLLL
eukprot:m.362939 g.362939  ORF g.362939 m.362939 type:complete len:929 (+) comp21199_c0_seq1:304-3090(+)